MEYFKPPNFAEESSDTVLTEGVLQSFSEDAEGSEEAEDYVPNILEAKRRAKKQRVDYSQFNSAEFNEVDTLLTNVEEYSKRIREDVDKYARNVRNETDLFRSETELELANALIKRIEAEKKAEEIIQNAEDTRDEVFRQGKEDGYQAGFAEGLKQQKEENEKNTGAILSLLDELKDLRKSLLQQHEDQIVRLSLLIAEKVVHKSLKSDKEFVLEILKNSIKHFEGMGSIKIKVHPVEFDFIKQNQPALEPFLEENQIVSVRADNDVSPAAPIIESDFSMVELDLKKQFKEIEDRLSDCVEDRRVLFT